MSKTSTRVRDAKTGLFVPAKEAIKHPGTTITQTMKVGPPKKRK